jgi:hypothetical protein
LRYFSIVRLRPAESRNPCTSNLEIDFGAFARFSHSNHFAIKNHLTLGPPVPLVNSAHRRRLIAAAASLLLTAEALISEIV